MKIEKITLLSTEEFRKYLKYIPPKMYNYWLRSGVKTNAIKSCYVKSHYHTVGAADIDNCLCIHPALIVSDLNKNPGDKIKYFDLEWIVLDFDLIFCCSKIFESHFDLVSNEWETSYIKKRIEEWLKDKCQKDIFLIAVKNAAEYSLLKSLCNKFHIELVEEMSFNKLIKYSDYVFLEYNPHTKQLLLGDIYDVIGFTLTFEKFCDYITEEN